jgi:hypothetical protein
MRAQIVPDAEGNHWFKRDIQYVHIEFHTEAGLSDEMGK